MNLLLFQAHEWGKFIVAKDPRAIHCREILGVVPGQELRVGLVGVGTGLARVIEVTSEGISIDFPPVDVLIQPDALLPLEIVLGHPRPPVLRRLCKDFATLGLGELSVCGTALGEKSYFSSRFWKHGLWHQDFLEGASQGSLVLLPELRQYWSVGDYIRRHPMGMVGESQGSRLGRDEFSGTRVDISDSSPEQVNPAQNHTDQPMLRKLLLHPNQGGMMLHEYLCSTEGQGGEGIQGVKIAVGPERGWTDAEVALFIDQGYEPVHLGNRIWRTEMAGLFAASIACQVLESVRGDSLNV